MTTRNMKELASNLMEARSNQQAEIKPNGYATFNGKEGRNYVVVITNLDDSYDATVQIYDLDWGHLVKTVIVEPFRATAVTVEMGKGNGIRVYNESNEQSPDRPTVFATCYPA